MYWACYLSSLAAHSSRLPCQACVLAERQREIGGSSPCLGGIASHVSPWYDDNMDTTPFELTPEQKGMLASLSRQTGRSIPALIAEALEELQEHVHSQQGNGETHGGNANQEVTSPQKAVQPIWEQFIEASLAIPDEELDRLPIDGATQHDHYIYGTPKRPV